MKKYLFLAALGLVTLASCTSDDLVVQGPAEAFEEESPIIFSSLSKGMTRADFTGADAAERLGNKFVVAGKKGDKTTNPGTIVFDNYLVEYLENTANTTESNSCNWEYVGKGLIKHAEDHGITKQTIKYWDYTKDQYDFIAWSTGSKTAIYSGDPAAGQVLVSAINPNAMDNAVTFTGTAEDLKECFISDITTVKKGAAYGQPVTLSFRQLGTKVRIAIYETIPGYSVKNVEFYNAAATGIKSTTAKLFTTTANDIYTEGTYTVTYPTVDGTGTQEDYNQAHVTFAPKSATDQTTIVDWGTLNYTIREDGESSKDKVYLGRSSNTATFAGDAEKNYYEIFLPNQTGTNLNLRVNYTLEAIDGGEETIDVKGATAQVPSIYTQWKPGFAYTYIFKISDKTNGTTGVYDPTKPDDVTVNSDPTGLYPITFDAVVVNAEDNDQMQETITTVSAPSITTYQKGSTVVNNNEYLASTGDIYVTVNDGSYAEVTGLSAGDDVSAYYKFNTTTNEYEKCGGSETAVDGTKYYQPSPVLASGALQALTGKAALYKLSVAKTEAEVIDAIQIQDDDADPSTIKGRNGLVLTEKVLNLTNKVEYGVDGNTITVGTDQAAKFTPNASGYGAGTYAFVYTKKGSTSTTDKFQAVTKASGASVNGYYRYAQTAAPAGDVQKGVKYFTTNNASTAMITAFLGQDVSNLYLDAVGTIASGYAVSGTTYYYTTDNGQSYKAAHNVAYATNMLSGLFEEDTTPGTYKLTTDTGLPTTGKAYYYYDTANDKYIYCVFLPQQADDLYVIDETAAKVACVSTDKAVNGMTYFDKYTQNDGVYYVKVIKVQ